MGGACLAKWACHGYASLNAGGEQRLMYLAFLRSIEGQLTVLVVALLIVCALLVWARGNAERVLILGTAALMSGIIGGIYALALANRWWSGDFFDTPLVVQASLAVPLLLVGLTAWLAGYRWLIERTNQALQIYVAVSVLIVLGVAVAHRLNLGRGKILVGPDWTVLYEAVIGELLAWIPVLVLEWLRRTLERTEFVP